MPSVLAVDHRIKEKDADFRRKLAMRLFFLFSGTVVLSPMLLIGAALFESYYPEIFDFEFLLEKGALLASGLVGTVAGIFGTVMGFYYGASDDTVRRR